MSSFLASWEPSSPAAARRSVGPPRFYPYSCLPPHPPQGESHLAILPSWRCHYTPPPGVNTAQLQAWVHWRSAQSVQPYVEQLSPVALQPDTPINLLAPDMSPLSLPLLPAVQEVFPFSSLPHLTCTLSGPAHSVSVGAGAPFSHTTPLLTSCSRLSPYFPPCGCTSNAFSWPTVFSLAFSVAHGWGGTVNITDLAGTVDANFGRADTAN